jgi:hypothetical protein
MPVSNPDADQADRYSECRYPNPNRNACGAAAVREAKAADPGAWRRVIALSPNVANLIPCAKVCHHAAQQSYVVLTSGGMQTTM